MGSIGQNSTFTDLCHVAYQINGNHKRSNMEAKMPTPPPLTLWMSSKSEHGHDEYQIKWNHEMQQHGSKSQIFYLQTPSHGIGVKIQLY